MSPDTALVFVRYKVEFVGIITFVSKPIRLHVLLHKFVEVYSIDSSKLTYHFHEVLNFVYFILKLY